MTYTVISSDISAQYVAFSFVDFGDDAFIPLGVFLQTTETFSATIWGQHGEHHLQIDGYVESRGHIVFLSGGNNSLEIGRTGSVLSLAGETSLSAIIIEGGDNTFLNLGIVVSAAPRGVVSGPGVTMQGSNNSITNVGHIETALTVLNMGAGDHNFPNGENLSSNNSVYNHGLIYSKESIWPDAAIDFAFQGHFSENGYLLNTGSIYSIGAFGVNAGGGSGGTVGLTVENSGTISGELGAIVGSHLGDTIINSGILNGNVTLGGGDDKYDGRGGDGVDGSIFGQDGDDLLIGGASNDRMYGDAGSDDLRGRDGLDYLNGGAGDDVIFGGNGDDDIFGGDGNDRISGGSGDDLIEGGNGTDLISGGAGNDLIRGGNGANQRLRGDDGNDHIVGGASRDIISGGNGDDRISGFGGDDLINGGAGNDLIVGGFGNDSIRGGEGIDTAKFLGTSAEYLVYLDASSVLRIEDQNIRGGNEGTDSLSGIEFLQFSDGVFAVDDLLGA